VIARVWRGWTKPHDADAYAEFLSARLLPSVAARVGGFRGADVFHRRDGPDVEFLVITFFDSLDDVRRFAGDRIDVPVIEPEAAGLLVRGDDRVQHYGVSSSER
jgi:antibiotic biosynthesis monooxygenase (ABM) superfamily enzyme